MQEYADRNSELQLAAVTFAGEPAARQFVMNNNIRCPLLIDGTRRLYREYGMLKASYRQVWGFRTWWGYAGAIFKGRLPAKTNGDIQQQGGNVLIDPHGIVRLHHVGEGSADRPALEKIDAIIAGT